MAVSQPNGCADFPVPTDMGPREWGTETLLVVSLGNYTLKRIDMTKGSKGGLQYHHKKDEAGVMISGRMQITYDPGFGSLISRTVGPGDSFHFPQGAVHKATALTDCSYIEVSTPFYNDRCHVEAEYGIETEDGGLPSTTPDEVEMFSKASADADELADMMAGVVAAVGRGRAVRR